MKEVLIFIAIVVISLVVFSAFQNNGLKGADLLGALRFDFGVLRPSDQEESQIENPLPQEQTQTDNNSVPAPAEISSPTVSEPTMTKPIISEPTEGVTSPRKPEALSLFYQKVRISGITKANKYHPSIIRLRVSTKDEIDLTGFIIQTRHGEFKIPQGMEKYISFGVEKDIISDGYLNIYLIAGTSPLAANAFRINTCFGYLKQYNDFYPSVSNSCPKPKIEDLYELNPYCQDYILDLRSCELPDYMNDLKISSNSYCTRYITENLNYPGCFQNYKNEDNFLKNYWYIYTKSDLVEPLHDIIYLYDQKGYLVDDYTY